MIKAVILDLDDTLYINGEAAFANICMLLTKMGHTPPSRRVFFTWWGLPFDQAISHWSPDINIKEFTKLYYDCFPSALEQNLFDQNTDDNLQVLDTLLQDGKQLFVLTSRTHSELRHLLEPAHELAKRISHFYYKDNLTHHKPDPRVFGQIESEHGWKPKECVYVGDSVTDAVAAKGARLHFIASLESGFKTTDAFQQYDVDAFICNFTDLVQTINKLEMEMHA